MRREGKKVKVRGKGRLRKGSEENSESIRSEENTSGRGDFHPGRV